MRIDTNGGLPFAIPGADRADSTELKSRSTDQAAADRGQSRRAESTDRSRAEPPRRLGEQLQRFSRSVGNGLDHLIRDQRRSGLAGDELRELRHQVQDIYKEFRADLGHALRQARASGERQVGIDSAREALAELRREVDDLIATDDDARSIVDDPEPVGSPELAPRSDLDRTI